MKWDELEKAAKAATPGPWIFENRNGDHPLNDQDGWGCDGLWAVNGGFILGAGPGWDSSYVGPNEEDDEYIAAANPAAILDLLAELRRLAAVEAELEALKKAISDAQPVAWRTFDGEGGYDYRDYAGHDDYIYQYVKRNGGKSANWVDALYTLKGIK